MPSKPTAANSCGIESVPCEWLFLLDAPSLLRLQVAGLHIDDSLIDEAWRHLCARELGLAASNLQLLGSVPTVVGSEDCTTGSARARARASSWRRIFYDLEPAGLRNSLRCTGIEYEFLPSLYGEPGAAPEGVDFPILREDADCRGALCCRLQQGYSNRDRCVVAFWPLASTLSATAIPFASDFDWQWRVAYRSAAYYEVTIEDDSQQKPARSSSLHTSRNDGMALCVSVGLCTPRFSRHACARQQAGWDAESWGLHGDDGHLFHASSRGVPFEAASPGSSGRWRATFGPGDVVGCGICLRPPQSESSGEGEDNLAKARRGGAQELAHERRCIFYTLNGLYLGIGFDVDDLPWDVPVWPCVGLDTLSQLSFNFGQRPFCFNLDAKFPLLNVTLDSMFETTSEWPRGLSSIPATPNPTPATPGTPAAGARSPEQTVSEEELEDESSEGPELAETPRNMRLDSVQNRDSAAGAMQRLVRWARSGDESISIESEEYASLLPSHTSPPRLMPLCSKFTQRDLFGTFASMPARIAVRRYRNAPRWLDPVDRIVADTLAGGVGHRALRRGYQGLGWMENIGNIGTAPQDVLGETRDPPREDQEVPGGVVSVVVRHDAHEDDSEFEVDWSPVSNG
eukprot:TRINITY_DN7057_c0_g1_i1.p1 TRINITY_DN7057_c0_g1~~TRINITY_DN7057_c0_g1_i1.p1  ORF type:complete len:628 (+),score=82.58 TRINITY_DN7057_c0_g1_i1:37-1920(+)